MVQNKAVVFSKIPDGLPKAGEHLTIEDTPIDLEAKLEDGSLLLKTIYASVDPYMRGRLRDPNIKSYSPAMQLNKPLTTRVLAKIVKSANPKFKEGDLVTGFGNLAEYTVSSKAMQESGLEPTRVIQNPHKVDLPHFLGALGNVGLTAFSSLYEIGQIGDRKKAGQTIFVSAASGAVGQIVCQIAKHEGLRVIGSTGDDRKAEFLKKDLGIDGIVNYKKEDTKEALQKLAPDGIDLYYENVGGQTLEAALNSLKRGGIIIACGMISGYNSKPEEIYNVKNLFQFVAKELTMKGFLSMTYFKEYDEQHRDTIGRWIADGSFKPALEITEGIEKGGDALVEIFQGKNIGKSLVKISDP